MTDFGLARIDQDESGLTSEPATLGTIGYMAPEQASGDTKRVTTAADVYGLGAVLYALLTGRPPFPMPNALETLRQVIEKEPARPASSTRSVDRDLETVCLKCLEKEPSRRYSSAEAMADDLDRWLRQEPIRARPTGMVTRGWKWAQRKPALAASWALGNVRFIGLAVLWQSRRQRALTAMRRLVMHRR